MMISLILLWALDGWCGTTIPYRVIRRIPGVVPDPPPEPWPIITAIGIVGGIIGGYLFMLAFGHPVPWDVSGPQPEPWVLLISAAASSVGAFVGSRIAGDLYGLVRGGGRQNRD